MQNPPGLHDSWTDIPEEWMGRGIDKSQWTTYGAAPFEKNEKAMSGPSRKWRNQNSPVYIKVNKNN
jgi:hypothetical protein